MSFPTWLLTILIWYVEILPKDLFLNLMCKWLTLHGIALLLMFIFTL